MTGPSNRRGSGKFLDELRAELGSRHLALNESDPTGPLAYRHPGGGGVIGFFHDTPLGPILQVDAMVAAAADWQNPGLEPVLLAEQAAWCYGRAERRGNGIVIEHNLRADTPADQIAAVFVGLADTAVHLRHDLGRMGALTVLEEGA